MKCCQERSAQLMEYAAGNLSDPQAAELERHLSGCSCCREELQSWRLLEGQLRAFPLVDEPAGFKSAVMSRIAAETLVARTPVAYMPVDPVLVGALGALLLGIAALLAGVGTGTTELSFDGGYWVDLAGQLGSSVWNLTVSAVGLALSGLAQAAFSDLMGALPVLTAAVLLAIFAIGPSELASALRLQSRES